MAKRSKDDYIDIISNDPKLERKLKRRRKKMRRTKGQKAVRAISIIAIILALLVCAYLFVTKSNFFGERLQGGISTPNEIKEKSVGFLICGVDFENGTGRGKLTDIQMYVNFDVKGKKISILQIPRDTYVTQDETSTGKINAIFARSSSYGKNGIQGLAEYVNKAYKLPVDHYATVNMTTFKKIVDDIGGVKMNVPTTITLEGVTIRKGLQTLNGLQAEKVVRFRKGVTGSKYYGSRDDIGRIKMQRLFMAALIKKLKEIPVADFVGILTPIMTKQEVKTDLNLEEVLKYMGAMQGVDLKHMIIEMMPGEGKYTSYGQSVYTLHKQETADLLNEKFRPYGKKYSADELQIVELQNTTSYNTNTTDNLDDLLDPDYIPGRHKETSSKSNSSK